MCCFGTMKAIRSIRRGARCEAVRRDLRAMTGTRRTHWTALFRHIKRNAPAKPAKSWLKAEKRLAAVGREDFRDRFGRLAGSFTQW